MSERDKYIGEEFYDVYGHMTRSVLWGRIDNTQELGIEQAHGGETHFVPVFQENRFLKRRLAVEVTGPENGRPVIFCHGMPGGRLGPKPDSSLIPGVRLIAYDRPGYGFSSSYPISTRTGDPARAPKCHPTHIENDVLSIANYFGLKRFSIVGRSRGTPHALAAAALLPEVERMAIIAPFAPPQAMGGDKWYEGMNVVNTRAFGLAFEGRELELRQELKVVRLEVLRKWGELQAGVEFQEDPNKGILRSSIAAHAAALKHGIEGYIDDAFGVGWWSIICLSDITTPTLIWAGDNDTFAPVHHAKFIADQLPNAELYIQKGASHFAGIGATALGVNWCVGNIATLPAAKTQTPQLSNSPLVDAYGVDFGGDF